MSKIDVRNAGAAPIISYICKELKIRETIDSIVKWDEKQCLLSPGTHVEALLINILSRRNPLYQVEEFYQEQDVELLFGKGVTANNFNDDVLGYTLDKISAANPKKVFSSVALRALAEEKLTKDTIRVDTTACLSYGTHTHPEGLQITYGYNKERRRDLKQFKIGLAVTNDGFPIFGEILNGNLSDKIWNKKLLEKIPDYFNLHNIQVHILVFDSAFVTKDNLELAVDNCNFISRLPHTYKLASELIEEACYKDDWLNIGQFSDKKKAASYKIQEFSRELYDHQYRFVVVHSDQYDKRKKKSLDRKLAEQKLELEKEATKLMKTEFACEPDALNAINNFLKIHDNPFYPIVFDIKKMSKALKREKPGRPRKDEVRQYTDVYQLKLQIGKLDQNAYKDEENKLGCFVLISNVPQDYNNSFSALEILKEYKSQTIIENLFRFVKDPVYVGPIWIKRNDRLEALCYIILMALAVYIVLQKRVRDAMLNEEEPLVLAGRVKSFSPTGQRVLQLFSEVKVVYIKDNGFVKRILPDRYYALERVLNMIGFDMSIYTEPRAP